MTRYTIANGEKEKVINRDAAQMVTDESDDTKAIKFQVVSGGTTRFARENEKQFIRTAETFEVGDWVYLDPLDTEWWAFADGQQVTVETALVRYQPLDWGGV